MKRREFLKNIVGAAAAVTIGLRLSSAMPGLADGVSLMSIKHPGSGVMTRADFAAQMQESLNEAFKDTFSNHYLEGNEEALEIYIDDPLEA